MMMNVSGSNALKVRLLSYAMMGPAIRKKLMRTQDPRIKTIPKGLRTLE